MVWKLSISITSDCVQMLMKWTRQTGRTWRMQRRARMMGMPRRRGVPPCCLGPSPAAQRQVLTAAVAAADAVCSRAAVPMCASGVMGSVLTVCAPVAAFATMFTTCICAGVPGSTAFRTHLATGRSGRAAAAVAAADAAAVARTAGTAHSAATYARIAALASERTAAAGAAGGTGGAWWKKGDRVRVTSGSSAWDWGLPATAATSLQVCYQIHYRGRRVAGLVQRRSYDMKFLRCHQCHSTDRCGVRAL